MDLTDLVLKIEPLWRGFDHPVYLTNAGDGSNRLFVAEQGGKIWVISDGTVRGRPFLDISSLVSFGGERGLLGVAFSPDFETDGRMYIDYTDRSGDTVVACYTTDTPASLTPTWGEPKIIFTADQPYANHNGGCLQFGPDKMLYIAMGDGGSAGDPRGNAQNVDVVLGKLLRIDVLKESGSAAYSIPADNPFVGRSDARPEIWAYGLRNPWRFSFDPKNGDLWIADVGQSAWEEINHVSGTEGGLNYGWNLWEGDHAYRGRGTSRDGFIFPIAEYGLNGSQSVTGGYVYRGHDYPALVGTYLYADYVAGWIAGIRLEAPDGSPRTTPEVRTLLETDTNPSSFGVDEQGELYLVDYNGTIWAVDGAAENRNAMASR
ncbi:MAG: PQQ-dependent sugar dehydrogenase [Coriobacteriia bacterium]